MLEFLFELIGEFLIQAVGEVLVEVGLRSLAAPFQREANPWLAAVGYLLFGAAVGGLSLLVFPNHLTPPGLLRKLNLIFTPLAVGGCMAALGAWRARRGQSLLRIDRFVYGAFFAASMGTVRFFFAA